MSNLFEGGEGGRITRSLLLSFSSLPTKLGGLEVEEEEDEGAITRVKWERGEMLDILYVPKQVLLGRRREGAEVQ